MNKKEFYREQAEKFRDFADRNPSRDLLCLFEEWAESKDFSDEDKKEIFREFISLLPKKKQILIPNLKVRLKNDPALLRDVIKVILHAIELADKEDTEKDKA